eukprot:GHVH01003824.1.p1 GENE.GHVH01003824.1~~GHVH01003824.1.p1  ORF type:complete len:139 (+),score=17.69 GHVH01003824.1:158-574(+)
MILNNLYNQLVIDNIWDFEGGWEKEPTVAILFLYPICAETLAIQTNQINRVRVPFGNEPLDRSGSLCEDYTGNVIFNKQDIPNSCGTQAIFDIANNVPYIDTIKSGDSIATEVPLVTTNSDDNFYRMHHAGARLTSVR